MLPEGYWVYKLSKNQVVHRNQAALAHTSETVIQQMKDIANKESAPEGLIFGDRNNDTTILDLEEEDALKELFDEDYDDDQETELEGDHEVEEEFFHDDIEHEDNAPDTIIDDTVVEADEDEYTEEEESDVNEPMEEESRRSARSSRVPPRYPDEERVIHNHVYFQVVDEYKESRAGALNQVFQDPGQYHNIEATLSSKQYMFSLQ